MLCSTVVPVSSYWSCLFQGTILRMWLDKSGSSKGPTTFVDFAAFEE
jgi:hypothetical protein